MLCRRRSRALGCLVHHVKGLRRFTKYRAHGCESGRDEWPLADGVVVHVAVDRTEVVREVDVDTGGNHSDQGEEERVCTETKRLVSRHGDKTA